MSSPSKQKAIYHVCREQEWRTALNRGRYHGSSQDRADGFIHFSDFNQVKASVAKHRAGQDGLVILTVDPNRLPETELRWEPSRGGALFPHLYGALPIDAVIRADPLPLGDGGEHDFPPAFDDRIG